MRLMQGDELRLRYNGEMRKPWSGEGHVIKLPNSIFSDRNGHVIGLNLTCSAEQLIGDHL